MNNKTMKEKYEVIVSGNYTTEKVIQFIAQQNAYLLALCGRKIPIPPEIRQEVMEFVRYFDETCSDKMQQALWDYYGRMPFIFTVADRFMWEDMICSERKCLSALNNRDKNVAKSLMKRLWNIRRDRIITFVCDDESSIRMEIAHSVPADMLDDVRAHLLYWCAKIIHSTAGSLCVRTIDRKGKVEIFGIGAGGGKWKPITREEMIDAHTLMPDGTRIEREKGVIYTEIGNIK